MGGGGGLRKIKRLGSRWGVAREKEKRGMGKKKKKRVGEVKRRDSEKGRIKMEREGIQWFAHYLISINGGDCI
jgi:hypothetical protein